MSKVMPIELELRDKILSACKDERYKEAADFLVGDTKSSVTYEEVLSSLEHIGPKINQAVLENISNIYQKNMGNLAMLKSKLHNIVSSHSMVGDTPDSGKVNSENLKGKELENFISGLRKKQKEIIAKTGKPDRNVAQQLSALITKKQNLEDKDHGDAFKKKEVVTTGVPPKGAKNWFVLPEASELDKYEDMRLVVGSPVISVLRERYERNYKTTIKDDIRHSTKLTADQQFQRKKELDRERAFVESYKDTSAVEDQDIFVHQIASKFITDQYDIIEPKVDNDDNQVRHYEFADGKLVDSFDRESKLHFLKIEGSVPGAFTISIKRRTDSGRIIDDVYDIVEFRDGRAVNYAYSSKGNVSLQTDDVKRSIGQANITLEIPKPSRMVGEAPVVAEQEEVEKEQEPPKVEAENLTPPPKPEAKESLPPAPGQKEPVEKKAPEPVVQEKVAEEDSDKALYDKGFLESQLRTAIAGKKTSKTTIRYLVDQLAEAEGRRPEDLAKEFGIKDLPEKHIVEEEKVVEEEKPKIAEAVVKPKKRKKKKEKNNSEELKMIKKELKKTFNPVASKKNVSKSKPKTQGSSRKA